MDTTPGGRTRMMMIVNFCHFGFDVNLTFSQGQILVNFRNVTKDI